MTAGNLKSTSDFGKPEPLINYDLLQINGPWRYALSAIYYTPEVTAAVQALRAAESAPEVISQLAA
jgi:hypothetical protein